MTIVLVQSGPLISALSLPTIQFSLGQTGVGGCMLVPARGVTQLNAGRRPARASASKRRSSFTCWVHCDVSLICLKASSVDQMYPRSEGGAA